MIVKELIERLQQHDPNAVVCVSRVEDWVVNRDGSWEADNKGTIWEPLDRAIAALYCEGQLCTEGEVLMMPGDPTDLPAKAVFLVHR